MKGVTRYKNIQEADVMQQHKFKRHSDITNLFLAEHLTKYTTVMSISFQRFYFKKASNYSDNQSLKGLPF
jgi:hypothetical protein